MDPSDLSNWVLGLTIRDGKSIKPHDSSNTNAGSPGSRKVNIIMLPAELLAAMFSYLGPVASTCFGLSYKPAYANYKRAYPGPVSLQELSCPYADGTCKLSVPRTTTCFNKWRLSINPRQPGMVELQLSSRLGCVLHTWFTSSSQYRL
jgi:hypothetical protein